MQFRELKIIPPILRALEKENYEVPTPIQEKAIPYILEGRDLLGCAQTGTGKTAAFAIPTLQLLCENRQPTNEKKGIRALIVTPTRELAIQIYESFCTYGKFTRLKYCVIFGGVSQKPQEQKLQEGVDVLVATPGRLNDLFGQGLVDLKQIKILILDEADRMLDMGFINDVKKIIAKTPINRQTLLFSATMPADIAALSSTILKNPARVEITPVSSTVDTIQQYLYYVDKVNKKDLLLHILKDKSIESALVFTRTKHGADRIVKQLSREKITAQAIHGDKSQGARQNALNNFKARKLRILIATDIAARGIDIDELSHVFNYDLPNVPETYVHRIGRTGRAGLDGVAISFCDFDEKPFLADIERLIGKHLQEVKEHPYPLMNEFPAIKNTQPRREPSSKNEQKREISSNKTEQLLITPSQGYEANKRQMDGKNSERKVSSKQASSKQISSKLATSKQISSKQASSKQSAAPKRKFRMTADGTLKEKRSSYQFFKSSSRKAK